MCGLLILSYSFISFFFSILMYGEYFSLSEKDPLMITGTPFQKMLKQIFLFQYGTWYVLRDTIKPSGIFLLCVMVTLLTWYASIFAAGMFLLFKIWNGVVWVFLKLFAYEDTKETIRDN